MQQYNFDREEKSIKGVICSVCKIIKIIITMTDTRHGWKLDFISENLFLSRIWQNRKILYSGKLWRALNLANQSSECIGKF